MNLSELEGTTYGPTPWRVAVDAVADFVEVTGDDPERWTEHAPPGFAAAALFAVAPDLLALLYDHSVIHGEQTFHWKGPLAVGGLLDVSGTVTRVRERAGVHFITFEMRAGDVLAGKSLFLASGEAIPGGQTEFERPEPPHSYHGQVGEGEVSASRADLIRYASATRDWNPVHWDHEAGVAAGFPGVVVHGLLQAAWALRVFATTSDAEPTSARYRFKNPLLPGRPVSIDVDGGEVVVSDVDTEYLTANITTADE
ncbi:MAG: MaoC/PaaZ C-terminal domain-containing protein [Acidimicrobiia bacterium]